MINLTTAVFGKMTSATDLYADIGGRLRKGEAQQGDEMPYVVFSVIGDMPQYPGGHTLEDVLLQFSLFSEASGSTEIENMLTHLRSLYDDCTLTITSNTLIYFIRGNFTALRDEVISDQGTVGIWHYVQEYDVMALKT